MTALILSAKEPFVGRVREADFIKKHILHQNIMIFGASGMGKSALLNHLKEFLTGAFQLVKIPKILKSKKTFLSHLFNELHIDASLDGMQALYRYLRTADKQLLIVVDECADDRELFVLWRHLCHHYNVRFLIVAHGLLHHLDDSASPLFEFATGSHYHGQAIHLSALSWEDANRACLAWERYFEIRWPADVDVVATRGRWLGASWGIPELIRFLGSEIKCLPDQAAIDAYFHKDGQIQAIRDFEGSLDTLLKPTHWAYPKRATFVFESLAAEVQRRYEAGGRSLSPSWQPMTDCHRFTVAQIKDHVGRAWTRYNGLGSTELGTWAQTPHLERFLWFLTRTRLWEPAAGQEGTYQFTHECFPSLWLSRKGQRSWEELLQKSAKESSKPLMAHEEKA